MTPPDVLALYRSEFGTPTTFVEAFLHPTNLVHIQMLEDVQLANAIPGATIHTPWNAAMQWSLVVFAHQYASLSNTIENVVACAAGFATSRRSVNETLYTQQQFYTRWKEQCIPDPNNVPLPMSTRPPEKQVDVSEYLLSNHPAGYKYLPQY